MLDTIGEDKYTKYLFNIYITRNILKETEIDILNTLNYNVLNPNHYIVLTRLY